MLSKSLYELSGKQITSSYEDVMVFKYLASGFIFRFHFVFILIMTSEFLFT